MQRSPRNVKIAISHTGLTHYGGILFVSEFGRMLQLRRFLTRRLLFWLLGELTRPQNRPTLRFANSLFIQKWGQEILHRVHRLKPLQG
jgi:anthranilate phosphoribosyltransferase